MLEILDRHFVEKPWGRNDVPSIFGLVDGKLGEVWFDRQGEPLPILVKWLFTSERLSVQVHPNDEQARARGLPSGKEECWIVTEADEGATLGIGLTEQLTSEQLREASLSGEIEQLLDWKPVKPGDWYFIPAGTVHAIGAGVRLVEVQQNADITYRLYDYGRPRELHLDDGISVSHLDPYDGPHEKLRLDKGTQHVVECPHFTIDYIKEIDAFDEFHNSAIFVPLSGGLNIGDDRISVGSVWIGKLSRNLISDADFRMLVVQPRS